MTTSSAPLVYVATGAPAVALAVELALGDELELEFPATTAAIWLQKAQTE